MPSPGTAAVGTWSGGRYLRFGEAIEEERLEALLRPGNGIETVLTADAYGQGEADSLLGRALAGVPRDGYSLVGAIGHDFYEGERDGPKGFPRFTDPTLRGPGPVRATTCGWPPSGAWSGSAQDRFDLLLLHNPDRTGYESEAVWDGMAALREAGLTESIGDRAGSRQRLHPRPDRLPRALRRPDRLGDGDPEPVRAVARRALPGRGGAARRQGDHAGRRLRRDLLGRRRCPETELPSGDHRAFRPEGWIEAGRARLERMRPIAERRGADADAARLPVEPRPRRRRVRGPDPDPGGWARERGRSRRSARSSRRLPAEQRLSAEDVAEIRAVGDNAGCMALKGASPDHTGEERPDRWPLTPSWRISGGSGGSTRIATCATSRPSPRANLGSRHQPRRSREDRQ